MIEQLFDKYLAVTSDPQAAATLVLAHVMSDNKPMMTVEEAAQQLNVSARTVRRMCQEGQLDCQKVGKSLRVKSLTPVERTHNLRVLTRS